tara:strand:+ start:2297 stop:2548 length:252 start_codon:yes stop_codon:yes gene_type:complete
MKLYYDGFDSTVYTKKKGKIERKKMKKPNNNKLIQLRIPEYYLKCLDNLAEATGITRSEIVRQAIVYTINLELKNLKMRKKTY